MSGCPLFYNQCQLVVAYYVVVDGRDENQQDLTRYEGWGEGSLVVVLALNFDQLVNKV